MKMVNPGLKIIVLVLTAVLILTLFSGCRGVFYIPGASYGYYIWEEDNNIYVEWSIDRKESEFEGRILTDGKITAYNLNGWEENDTIKVEGDKIEFSAALDDTDYSDGFSFAIQDYTYLEFDLKMNGGYDLSRVNLGGFLENPEESVFRIGNGYFGQLGEKPWYRKHPFSEFLVKLFSNKYFTFVYLFILGAVIIEVLRVTVLAVRKRKVAGMAISYAVLVVAEIGIYFILRFLVR